ncbi:hypothetical protein [Leifsonia sp. NPDC058230]|uniref:hypothetical protein n=1 Tax=Leifsonia sp. NPDC058230 TaxID=3346391 RepID=UPI0036DF7282
MTDDNTAEWAPGSSFPSLAYTEATICDCLGIEPETLQALVAVDRVLQVTPGEARPVYPAFQVTDDGSLLSGLDAVICELAGGVDDPWTWWMWLLAHPDYAGGKALWELLRDGETDEVVRAAGRSAWAWRP